MSALTANRFPTSGHETHLGRLGPNNRIQERNIITIVHSKGGIGCWLNPSILSSSRSAFDFSHAVFQLFHTSFAPFNWISDRFNRSMTFSASKYLERDSPASRQSGISESVVVAKRLRSVLGYKTIHIERLGFKKMAFFM